MFFKTSVLKRLFKDAYKGAGLTVGHMTDPEDEEVDGYYISSGWWVIWFNNRTFPKEAKAAIIELCGELPQPAQGTSTKSNRKRSSTFRQRLSAQR